MGGYFTGETSRFHSCSFETAVGKTDADIGQYIRTGNKESFAVKNKEVMDLLAESANKTGYTVCQLDTAVTADGLLAVVTRPYRGKVVL